MGSVHIALPSGLALTLAGVRLCRRPLAGARVHARQGAPSRPRPSRRPTSSGWFTTISTRCSSPTRTRATCGSRRRIMSCAAPAGRPASAPRSIPPPASRSARRPTASASPAAIIVDRRRVDADDNCEDRKLRADLIGLGVDMLNEPLILPLELHGRTNRLLPIFPVGSPPKSGKRDVADIVDLAVVRRASGRMPRLRALVRPAARPQRADAARRPRHR